MPLELTLLTIGLACGFAARSLIARCLRIAGTGGKTCPKSAAVREVGLHSLPDVEQAARRQRESIARIQALESVFAQHAVGISCCGEEAPRPSAPLNRRALESQLHQRLAEWRRRGTRLCLMRVDIDHFLATCRIYGEEAGQAALQSVERVLSGALREMDIIARFADDEFAVLLPATSIDEAAAAAKRLRAEIAATRFACGARSLRVTVSVGLAEVQTGDDAARLLERADAALHAAKRAGRNCVYLHNGVATRSLPAFEPSDFLQRELV
jgi:diguanylate cyclase (GGDEF)-like protein